MFTQKINASIKRNCICVKNTCRWNLFPLFCSNWIGLKKTMSNPTSTKLYTFSNTNWCPLKYCISSSALSRVSLFINCENIFLVKALYQKTAGEHTEKVVDIWKIKKEFQTKFFTMVKIFHISFFSVRNYYWISISKYYLIAELVINIVNI